MTDTAQTTRTPQGVARRTAHQRPHRPGPVGTATAAGPTTPERFLPHDELIVTKTDLKGRLTYTNDVFLRISALDEEDAVGRPHNIVRHPHMPRGVFRLLWDTVAAGEEIFAYVQNLAIDGAPYWVLAHVTPSYSPAGTLVGYHSTRRAPARDAVDAVRRTYSAMTEIESRHVGRGADLASLHWLQTTLADQGMTYSQWLWSLAGSGR